METVSIQDNNNNNKKGFVILWFKSNNLKDLNQIFCAVENEPFCPSDSGEHLSLGCARILLRILAHFHES